MSFSQEMLDEVMFDVKCELDKATRKHGTLHSAHEGYAVILEEVDELWAEVKKQQPLIGLQYREARQVAAMAIRFMLDVCGGRTS